MRNRGWPRREHGSAALELALGVCVLVLPTVLLVSALPVWLERHGVAQAMAREAARAYVLAAEPSQAAHAAHTLAQQIARNHRLPEADYQLRLSGRLAWGEPVTAQVRTRAPLLHLPGLGYVGGFTVRATHRELVDRYRSW